MRRFFVGPEVFALVAAAGVGLPANATADGVFSPNGKTLAVTHKDATIELWDLIAGKAVALYAPLPPRLLEESALHWKPTAVFAPDGSVLATVRGDEPVKIWRLPDGKELASLRELGVVASITFAPDSKTLVTIANEHKGTGRNLMTVWDLPLGNKRAKLRQREDTEFRNATFSKDAQALTILVGHRKTGVMSMVFWDMEDGKATTCTLPAGPHGAGEDGTRSVTRRAFSFQKWGYDPASDLGDGAGAGAGSDGGPVIHLLEDPDDREPDHKGIPLTRLVKRLKSLDVGERYGAVSAIRMIGPRAKPAVPALIDVLKDTDDEVRKTAAYALAEIGPEAKAAVPALTGMLAEKNLKVCHAAVIALEKIGPEAKGAVPALIEALRHSDDDVRFLAAGALAAIGPEAKAAVPALTAALADKNQAVSRAAANALKKITPAAPDR